MARRLLDQGSIGTREYVRITVNKLRKLVSFSRKTFQRSQTGYSVFCCFAGTYGCCCCGSVMLRVLCEGGGCCMAMGHRQISGKLISEKICKVILMESLAGYSKYCNLNYGVVLAECAEGKYLSSSMSRRRVSNPQT